MFTLSKNFERVVHERLYHFKGKNKLFYSGHGNKFERISWNFIFEWTKFEFSKNRNKLESMCSNFELMAVSIKRASDISPISSSAPRPLGAAFVPILLSEVEQDQRPSANGDRGAVVVGAGLCNGEGERAYTGNAPRFSF